MTKKDKEMLPHVQGYVRAVAADRLRRDGFVSFKERDCAWYRVVNNEVIQTLYFFTKFPYIPIILNVGYGIHPLYVEPFYPSGVNYVRISNDEVMRETLIMSAKSNRSYSSDIMVECPNDEYKGFDIIEEILQKMDSVNTAEKAYLNHKARYERAGTYWAASMDFFDEAIRYNDTDIFELCMSPLEKEIKTWNGWAEARGRKGKIADNLDHLALQKQALLTGNRDEVLSALQARQRKIVKALKRNVGIQVQV